MTPLAELREPTLDDVIATTDPTRAEVEEALLAAAFGEEVNGAEVVRRSVLGDVAA